MQRQLLLLSLLTTLSVGCSSPYLFAGGRPELMTIPHPSQGGVGPGTTIVFGSQQEEQQRGLPPNSLAQQAFISRADQAAICFNVTLRGYDRRYPDMRGWDVSVRSNSGPDTEVIVGADPSVQMMLGEPQVYDGLNPVEQQVGTETYCSEKDERTNQCTRWSERPVYSVSWVPGPVEVSAGGAEICFGNGGLLSGETQAIALRLNQWNVPGGPGRMTFQWEFSAGGVPVEPGVATSSGGEEAVMQPAIVPVEEAAPAEGAPAEGAPAAP